MKKMMFGAVLGAALVYVLDPELGPGRRDRIRAMLGKQPVTPRPTVPADATVDLIIVDDRAAVGAS